VVASDLSERRREEEELRRSRARLQELASGLEEAREAERTRVAREIHDELGQSLVGLTMDVAWIASRLPDDAPELRERSAAMRALLDATADSVRRIAAELRPGVLDDLGLEAAVRWQAGEVTRRSGLPVSVTIDPLPELDPALATALFRVLQEALTNVVRHASASRVEVRLAARGGMILLEVVDDGIGLPAAATDGRRRLGLLGMEERVRTWGGILELASRPGAGTVMRVELPVPGPNRGRSA
jgi:signal transduction histidine kinase